MRELKFRFWSTDKVMMDDHEGWVENIGINEALSCSAGYGYIIMQYTGLKDKNRKELYEGDLCIGYRHRLPTDGYTKKGFPDRIRYILEVRYCDGRNGSVGFHLWSRGVHPEDQFARDEYQYRSIQYDLRESRECNLVDNEVQWKGINETIEIIGNIYQHPHLIPDYDEHKHLLNSKP